MTQNQKIAIDFDETWTADPKLWSDFALLAIGMGHRVCIVSCRANTVGNTEEINASLRHWECQLPVFLADGSAKRWFMEQQRFPIDIWIDDMPESVKEGR